MPQPIKLEELMECVLKGIESIKGVQRIDLDEDTQLESDIGMDSLDLAELMFYVETQYKIDLPPGHEEIRRHVTVADVAFFYFPKINDPNYRRQFWKNPKSFSFLEQNESILI